MVVDEMKDLLKKVCIRWSKRLNSCHDRVFIFLDEEDNQYVYTKMASGKNNIHIPAQIKNILNLTQKDVIFLFFVFFEFSTF